MKLSIAYGTDVLVLPASVLAEMPPDSAYLHVLLLLTYTPALRADDGDVISAAAAAAGLPKDTVRNAVSYWCARGILIPAEEEQASLPPRIRPVSAERRTAEAVHAAETDTGTGKDADHAAKETEISGEDETVSGEDTRSLPPAKRQSALPAYTQAQTAELIESDPGLRGALDACQQAVGKLFTERESEQIAALYDAYGMDGEYLLTLFALCRKRGKTSVSYAVRTALGMYDDGIRTAAELNAKVEYLDRLSEQSYQIRNMLGIGDRAFTSAEKECIETWTMTWKFPQDVIRAAYEITVNRIGKPRISYIHKILSGWNEAGIRTTEDVRAAEERWNASAHAEQNGRSAPKKAADDTAQSTFDVDEFLELAMKRTFSEHKRS